MDSLRIALVIPGIPKHWGGTSFAVAALAEHLSAAGHEVTLVTSKISNHQRWSEMVDVPSTVRLELFSVQNSLDRWLYRSKEMRSWLERNIFDFDIVDIHGIWSFFAVDAANACLQARIPYIITPHGQMGSWDWKKKPWRKTIYFTFIFRQLWNAATAVRFLSEYEAKRSVFPARHRVFVIPNAITVNSRKGNHYLQDELRRELNISKDASVILFLGRVTKQKGVLELLEAFSYLWQQKPKAFLIIAGPLDGDYSSDVVRTIDRMQCKDNIRLLGPVYDERKVLLMSIARVFVTLSKNEGLPLAVLEALGFGIPVVITESTNLHEVSKYKAGLIVRDQPRDVANAIMKIVSDDEKHLEMSENASRLIQDNFVWEKVLPRLVSMYRIASRKASETI